MNECPLCWGEVESLGRYPMLKRYSALVCYCSNCQALFRHPMPTSERLSAYYATVPFVTSDAILRRRLRKLRRQARAVARLAEQIGLDRNGLVVDAGAGVGGLMFALRNKGYSNVIGVEGREAAVDYARHRLGVELATN